MPIYEWRGGSCGAERERLQRHDDPPPVCETCTEEMAKQVSRSSFHLRGDGWERDGYGLHQGERE